MPKGVYRRPWQREQPPLPRLTVNVARAATIRDPATGRAFDRSTEVFKKCLKIVKKR